MARNKREQELFDLLRARGVRKRVADTISSAAGKRNSRNVPKSVRDAVSDLRSLVGELEDRVTGGPAKRSAAAKKAASTRKRNATKRSTAAKKGAQTRARKTAKAGR